MYAAFIGNAGKSSKKTQKNSTVTVEGIVVDENNVPMPGITVNVQEKQTDAVTDEDGKFYMLLDPSDVLVVNLKGYRPVTNVSTINRSIR